MVEDSLKKKLFRFDSLSSSSESSETENVNPGPGSGILFSDINTNSNSSNSTIRMHHQNHNQNPMDSRKSLNFDSHDIDFSNHSNTNTNTTTNTNTNTRPATNNHAKKDASNRKSKSDNVNVNASACGSAIEIAIACPAASSSYLSKPSSSCSSSSPTNNGSPTCMLTRTKNIVPTSIGTTSITKVSRRIHSRPPLPTYTSTPSKGNGKGRAALALNRSVNTSTSTSTSTFASTPSDDDDATMCIDGDADDASTFVTEAEANASDESFDTLTTNTPSPLATCNAALALALASPRHIKSNGNSFTSTSSHSHIHSHSQSQSHSNLSVSVSVSVSRKRTSSDIQPPIYAPPPTVAKRDRDWNYTNGNVSINENGNGNGNGTLFSAASASPMKESSPYEKEWLKNGSGSGNSNGSGNGSVNGNSNGNGNMSSSLITSFLGSTIHEEKTVDDPNHNTDNNDDDDNESLDLDTVRRLNIDQAMEEHENGHENGSTSSGMFPPPILKSNQFTSPDNNNADGHMLSSGGLTKHKHHPKKISPNDIIHNVCTPQHDQGQVRRDSHHLQHQHHPIDTLGVEESEFHSPPAPFAIRKGLRMGMRMGESDEDEMSLASSSAGTSTGPPTPINFYGNRMNGGNNGGNGNRSSGSDSGNNRDRDRIPPSPQRLNRNPNRNYNYMPAVPDTPMVPRKGPRSRLNGMGMRGMNKGMGMGNNHYNNNHHNQNEYKYEERSRFTEDFEIISTIGNGSFGKVFKCRSKLDASMYAVKVAKERARGIADRERMLKEVTALAELSNTAENGAFHILRYHQAWMEMNKLHIVTELCTSTLLSEMTNGSFQGIQGIARQYQLLREMVLALRLIHQHSLVHLDVKPENIFVKDNRFLLGDFGLVNRTSVRGEVEEGDCRYMCLDLWSGNHRDLTKCDIFSLGITLYEIVSGKALPADGQEWQDVRAGKLAPMIGIPSELQDIVKQMTCPDGPKRPSAEELLKHRQLLSNEEKLLITERNKVKQAHIALAFQQARMKSLTPPKRLLTRSNTCPR